MEVRGRVLRETASRRAAAVEREKEHVKKHKKEKLEKGKVKSLTNEVSNLRGRVSHADLFP